MRQGLHYLRDRDLPYLANALDVETVRRLCRGFVRHEEGLRVIACRVTRLRYRCGERATLQYQVTLQDRHGSERTLWLAGYQYANRERFNSSVRRLERLKANEGAEIGMPPGLAIEPFELLLMRFPYDRRLPALMSFYFNIDQLLGERLRLLLGSNDWRLDSLDTQLTRWRVGLSAAVRISIVARHARNGETQRRELFLKHDPGRPPNGVAARLSALGRERKLPFALSPTILSLPRQGLTIQSAARGTSLEARLANGRASSEDARELGSVLAQWHTSGDVLQNPYSREKFETALERSVRVLSTGLPVIRGRLNRVAAGIKFQMLHRLQCPTHLDLKAEHIFFDAGRITLIDLDSAADADPMLDIAILYARLRHGEELYGSPKGAARNFASHVMRAYAPLVPPSWWYNFRACYAWALLNVAMHPFACQRAGWSLTIERLLREAELALEPSSELLSFLPNRELSGQDARRLNYSRNQLPRADGLR